jgi:hypothetical protein
MVPVPDDRQPDRGVPEPFLDRLRVRALRDVSSAAQVCPRSWKRRPADISSVAAAREREVAEGRVSDEAPATGVHHATVEHHGRDGEALRPACRGLISEAEYETAKAKLLGP